MGAVKLEIPGAHNFVDFRANPDPDWTFQGLLLELSSRETKLKNSSSSSVVHLSKSHSHVPVREKRKKDCVAFRMRIAESSDDEENVSQNEKNEGQGHDRVVTGTRFAVDHLFSDDHSEEESEFCGTPVLLSGDSLEDGGLFALKYDSQFSLKEEIRKQMSMLEIELIKEKQKYAYTIQKFRKYITARKEADKKLDMNYKRKIAEASDNHITAIQRSHELQSQIAEKKIQSDAAEARREKVLEEERLRQERANQLAEERARAEESAKLAAALAAAKEAALVAANEKAEREVGMSNVMEKSQRPGEAVRASADALNDEQERVHKLIKLEEENNSLTLNTKTDFSMQRRQIFRLIKQISGVQHVVRTKANEIIRAIMNTSCPQSISIISFAEKVVSNCENLGNSPFASAYVIVLVASKVPQVLDIILAELHRACIYTVPKHIIYSQSAFESKETYYKELGYRKLDGKFETAASFSERIKAYMSLYGALVQTEGIPGFQNLHGPKEGWAWLARFLNTLPANRFTGVALAAFLQVAGFALFSKYKSQFRKLLNVVRDDFLRVLKSRNDPELNPIVIELQSYIDDAMFTKEPEGRQLQGQLLSHVIRPE